MRLLLVVLLVQALASACGIVSPSVDSLIRSAKEEQAAGHHAAALIQLANVIQKDPKRAEAYYLAGVELERTDDFAAAVKFLNKALELHYEPTKVVPPLCRLLIATGEFRRALDRTEIDARGDAGTRAEMLTLRGLALI